MKPGHKHRYKSKHKPALHRWPWLPEHDAYLRREWGEVNLRVMQQHLGRTRRAIVKHAKRLGLPFGMPQGHVSIERAEELFGYDRCELLPILRWAGVTVRLLPTMHVVASRSPRRIVDEEEARRAVEKWLASSPETTLAASARLRIRPRVLRFALRAAGLHPGPNKWAVLPAAQWDALVASPLMDEAREAERRDRLTRCRRARVARTETQRAA